MGTMLASELILRAATILNDPAYEIWSQDELLRWLNDAHIEVVKNVPEANVIIGIIQLTAENSRQSLPSGALRLIDIIRVGGGRTSAAKAVRLIRREELDQLIPKWHIAAVGDTIDYYVYDPRMPRTFYVYPQTTTGVMVEAAYSALPTKLAAVSSAITIDDIYAPAMVDYMVYRAQCKDREDQGRGPQLATAFYSAFLQSLGIQNQITAALDPSKHTDEYVRQPKTL